MPIVYQVSTEYGEYTHGEIIAQCTTLEEATKWYKDTLEQCINDGESNFVDYICIEPIDADLDEDGNVENVIDYGDVLKEHVFNEPPE